jgi:hypothetical protein
MASNSLWWKQQRDKEKARADRLQAEVTEWEDWSNELALLLPEDVESWPGVNPEGAQESIIMAALEHLLKREANDGGPQGEAAEFTPAPPHPNPPTRLADPWKDEPLPSVDEALRMGWTV